VLEGVLVVVELALQALGNQAKKADLPVGHDHSLPGSGAGIETASGLRNERGRSGRPKVRSSTHRGTTTTG
jgi:hypothetical protein